MQKTSAQFDHCLIVLGTVRKYDGDGEDDSCYKMYLHFTSDFLSYQDLFSVTVYLKKKNLFLLNML